MKQLMISLVMLFFLSCGVEPSEVGSDFFTGGTLDFAFIDTSTVELSTVQFEKLANNTAVRVLLGSYPDEKLGLVTAAPFLQLSPSHTLDLEDEDVTYDYLALVLKYDEYFYYDTAHITVNVYRLSEEMELDDDGALYNRSSTPVFDEVLGTLSFLPRPHRDDSVEIRLSDDLGKKIFLKAKAGNEDLAPGAFEEYIRGFALFPNVISTRSLVGFAPSAELRLYYSDRSETPVVQKYLSFVTNRYFTRIVSDQEGTSLYPVPAEDKLPSAKTEDQAYLQAGVGLSLRVDLPYLRELKQHSNFYVVKALLEIYPVRKSFSETTPLPKTLAVFTVNKNNEAYQQLSSDAIFLEDVELGRDSHYALDATEFVFAQMELPRFRDDALLFVMGSDFAASADRFYAASPSYTYKTQLKIYYATVNDQ